MLKRAILIGLVAGLLVGGFHNLLTVPVIEEAIALEEAAAGSDHVGGPPLVSLGTQRVGLVIGEAIFGVILGALFAGLHALVSPLVRHPRPLVALAITAGFGFWSVSLYPALKYPSNPPGVGEAETLLFRQGFQLLFLALSAGGAVAVLALARSLRDGGRGDARLYGAAAVAYLAVVGLLFVLFPANPDPVSVPSTLLLEFRSLSVFGHLLTWALIALGVHLSFVLEKRPARSGSLVADR